MNITAALVTRIANASPEEQDSLIKQVNNPKGIIAKAKELMSDSSVDKEQNDRLDELIGICSFPEMLNRLAKEAFA